MCKKYAASLLSILEALVEVGETEDLEGRLDDEDRCLLGDLEACGVVAREAQERSLRVLLPKDTLRLFLPLFSVGKLRLRPVSIPECPLHFCTAIWKQNPQSEALENASLPVIVAGGQGRVSTDAALSCLGELAERLSLRAAPDLVEDRVFERKPDVVDLDADLFLGLSARQKYALFQPNTSCLQTGRESERNLNNLSNRRIALENCKDGRKAQLSSFCALFDEAAKAGLPDMVSTTGAAVHGSKKLAFDNALLEAAERDIFARCWYNRLGITVIGLAEVAYYLSKDTWEFLQCRKRQVVIALVQSEFDVHVAVAISTDEEGYGGALGVSAGWALHEAVEGAVNEMLQSEFSQELSIRSAKKPDQLSRAVRFGQRVKLREHLKIERTGSEDTRQPKVRYAPSGLLNSFHSAGIDLWRFDATHPVLKVPCVKILSPDLCTVEPRFGRRRLYPDPVQHDPELMLEHEERYRDWIFPY